MKGFWKYSDKPKEKYMIKNKLYSVCDISLNDFSSYLKKIKIYEDRFSTVIKQIDNFVPVVPSNTFSCLPKGGGEYLEMLEKHA